jgi:hypothetical protein
MLVCHACTNKCDHREVTSAAVPVIKHHGTKMYGSEMEASGQLYIPSDLPHTGKKNIFLLLPGIEPWRFNP